MQSILVYLALLAPLSAHALDLFRGGPLLWNDLNPEQQKTLLSGGQVAISQKVIGSDWPNNVAYQWVQATPEEAAAVFTDYASQKTYVPKVLESRVSQMDSPDHVYVDYTIDTGFLGMKSTYTVENRVKFHPEKSEYWVKWDFVKGSHATAIDGLVRIQPHAEGAIFFYQLYTVVPSGILSGIIRDQGFESLKNSVHAIVSQIHREKKSQPDQLTHQVHCLRDAMRAL